MNTLTLSIASAAIAGLLTGGVMKLGPDALADRPIGPQILVSGANKRVIDANGWYADTQLIASNGQIADYVLGTDWTQAVSYDPAYDDSYSEEVVADEPAQMEEAAYEPPVTVVSPPEPQTVSYPSVDGDILGGLHEAATPAQVVEVDADGETLAS